MESKLHPLPKPKRGRSSRSSKPAKRWYTTGEMARISNTTLRTVRFYEEAGILTPFRRSDGGHRLFEIAELDRLLLVTDMRTAGMSLDDIRSLLDVKQRAASGGAAARDALAVLHANVDGLNQKIEALQRLHSDLSETVKVAAACTDCSDGAFFPNRCNACGKMLNRGPLPRAMRVLWSVGKQPADPDDGTAEADAAADHAACGESRPDVDGPDVDGLRVGPVKLDAEHPGAAKIGRD